MSPIKIKNSKGISLVLVILLMSIILAIGLGLSSIFLQEIKMTEEIGNSVVAFYGADTGIEEVLMNWRGGGLKDYIDRYLPPLSVHCRVDTYKSGIGGCTADNFCIKSVGDYQKIKRAIEITY